jgi:alpha-glucosidase
MQSDYSLLVHLTTSGTASGKAYMDDGETLPPTPYRDVYFEACYGKVLIWSEGDYEIYNKLTEVVILVNDWSGPWSKVSWVQVDGQDKKCWTWDCVKGELMLNLLSVDLNKGAEITWG